MKYLKSRLNMIIVISIYILRFILKVLNPNLGKKHNARRKQQQCTALSTAKQEFISLNSSKWKNCNWEENCDGFILIEGFLASYGPNYLLRTGIIAKAIEEELHFNPLVLFDNYIENEDEKVFLYKSFNIRFFESIQNYQPSFFCRMRNAMFALKFYLTSKIPEDLLKLKFKGLVFGDLLYDTIIKNTRGITTVMNISMREFFYIYESLQLISTYSNILDRNDIKFYIATHSQFTTYGILFRLCLSRGIPTIETTDLQYWFHYRLTNNESIANFKYHDYLRHHIKLLLANKNESISITETDNMLNNRFNGRYDQSDVRRAYRDKIIYSQNELRDALNIQNHYPFVFIFAHIFSDSPQAASNGMLFRDYYIWLEETIKEACTIHGVNWIVKPHPAYAIYNEAGMIDEILAKHKGDNLFMCPNDLSPVSVIDVALAIVTAQGTVGIEYSCMGIPIILAGKPFYSGFGFTIEPKSIQEYRTALRNVEKYTKLSEDQKTISKKVFAAFMQMQQTDTSLIDSDVLSSVWGGDGALASSDRAFNLINEKLQRVDLMQYSLYKMTIELMKSLRD